MFTAIAAIVSAVIGGAVAGTQLGMAKAEAGRQRQHALNQASIADYYAMLQLKFDTTASIKAQQDAKEKAATTSNAIVNIILVAVIVIILIVLIAKK
jgi:hypothetical protein